MSPARADAIGMACVAVLFLAIGALALRLRLRTGQRNQWLYVGPAVALVALVLMAINLSGTAIVGG
jgi:hypothetical protein